MSKENRSKLIMDATAAPSDIKYPTNIDLLNQCREHLETAIHYYWAEIPHNGRKRKPYLNVSKFKRWTAKLLQKGIREQLEYTAQVQKRLIS